MKIYFFKFRDDARVLISSQVDFRGMVWLIDLEYEKTDVLIDGQVDNLDVSYWVYILEE